MTSQKDETLRRIREMWKEAHGFLPDADGAEEYCGVNELADLQSRSYDAGYQQGIEDAKKATREAATDDERRDGSLAPSVFTDGILMRLDALKAVDRG